MTFKNSKGYLKSDYFCAEYYVGGSGELLTEKGCLKQLGYVELKVIVMKKRVLSLVLALLLLPVAFPNAQAAKVNYEEEVRTFDFNRDTAAVITADGGLYTWGDGYTGQIGNGGTADQSVPVRVLEKAFSVSVGLNHTAAITAGETCTPGVPVVTANWELVHYLGIQHLY